MRGACSRAAGLLAPACVIAAGCGGPVEAPSPLNADIPVEYPAEMWLQGVEGTTTLRVLVSEEGSPVEVRVAEGSGSAELDSAAVAGVRTMEFAPARRGGRPTEAWLRFPVHFTRDDSLPDRPPTVGPSEESP